MDKKIGCYQILQELSKNSVFLVEDGAGTKKILKQYDASSNRILSPYEIKVLMNLKHKNILAPSDVFMEKELQCAVYEYSSSNNLLNYLKKKGKLTDIELLKISEQIIDAYQFLKDNELIHGNIKPNNILIDDDEQLTIKLTDFLFFLKKQRRYGKFVAPEIASGEIKPNIISDIYSIGRVIKFLLKNTESSSDTCSRLVKDCLEINPDERIKFDILALHPYFKSVPLVYKHFRGNLIPNIRFYIHMHLQRKKRYNFKLWRLLLYGMYWSIEIQRRIQRKLY